MSSSWPAPYRWRKFSHSRPRDLSLRLYATPGPGAGAAAAAALAADPGTTAPGAGAARSERDDGASAAAPRDGVLASPPRAAAAAGPAAAARAPRGCCWAPFCRAAAAAPRARARARAEGGGARAWGPRLEEEGAPNAGAPGGGGPGNAAAALMPCCMYSKNCARRRRGGGGGGVGPRGSSSSSKGGGVLLRHAARRLARRAAHGGGGVRRGRGPPRQARTRPRAGPGAGAGARPRPRSRSRSPPSRPRPGRRKVAGRRHARADAPGPKGCARAPRDPSAVRGRRSGSREPRLAAFARARGRPRIARAVSATAAATCAMTPRGGTPPRARAERLSRSRRGGKRGVKTAERRDRCEIEARIVRVPVTTRAREGGFDSQTRAAKWRVGDREAREAAPRWSVRRRRAIRDFTVCGARSTKPRPIDGVKLKRGVPKRDRRWIWFSSLFSFDNRRERRRCDDCPVDYERVNARRLSSSTEHAGF